MQAASTAPHSFLEKLGSGFASAFPILVIAGLLLSAVFIKPKVAPSEVIPIPIHPRYAFYSAHVSDTAGVWLAGRGNKLITAPALGQPWRIIEPSFSSNWQGVVALSSQIIVLAGNEGLIIRSEDGGATWSKVNTKDILTVFDSKFLRLKQAPNGDLWALAEFGNVLRSQDQGKNWQALRPKSDIGWNDIIFSQSRIVIVGEFGRILTSDNQGQTWSEKELPESSSLMSVVIKPNGLGVAVGLEGNLMITNDNGQEWSKVKPFTDAHLYSVTFDDDQFIAVGDKGWIAKSTDGRSWTRIPGKENDSSWRTEIQKTKEGLLLIGRNPALLNSSGLKLLTELTR